MFAPGVRTQQSDTPGVFFLSFKSQVSWNGSAVFGESAAVGVRLDGGYLQVFFGER